MTLFWGIRLLPSAYRIRAKCDGNPLFGNAKRETVKLYVISWKHPNLWQDDLYKNSDHAAAADERNSNNGYQLCCQGGIFLPVLRILSFPFHMFRLTETTRPPVERGARIPGLTYPMIVAINNS